MIRTAISVFKWIFAPFLSHSLSSEAYWLRENPSMKARLKPHSGITAWGRFSDWHVLHTLSLRALSQSKKTNPEEPLAATLDHWTHGDEEWTFRMGILFPDPTWEHFNWKRRICWHFKNLHERSCAINKLCWRAQQTEGELGTCGVNGTGELDSNAQFRDEQRPSDGTYVSRDEWQPTAVLSVTQEDHLPVFRISVSWNVLPLSCQGLLSSGETDLESLEFVHTVHYELPKALAESIHLQTCRRVFLDWW